MNVINQLIPLGHPNRPGTKRLGLKAIVVHYTANDAPTATDTMNAKYFARSWFGDQSNPQEYDWITKKDAAGKTIMDPATGKPKIFKVAVSFRYGSAHIIADMDSVTMAVPLDEIAWAVGDTSWLPKTNGYGGRQPVAGKLMDLKPNAYTVSVEICNNDAIPNSSKDWDAACSNASAWISEFVKSKGLKINAAKSMVPQQVVSLAGNEILLLRHFDITNKPCPAPFMGSSDHQKAWESFVTKTAGA